MITDARVFEAEFVPGDVKHRPAEVSHLSDTLRPITTGDRPEPSFLYGPSGAGKTCIARHTIERLRETVVSLDHQYINCWEDRTRFKLLYRLLEGIDQAFDIHRQSTPKDQMLARLKRHDQQYVVILDEVDQLTEKDLLYDLYRMPNLTMVLIANREEDVFSTLDQRLSSRLHHCVRIRFDQYSLSELVTILEDRVRWGLESDAIGTEQLHLIADAAAGDARVAIATLRTAARIARQNGTTRITESVVERAVPEAKSEVRQKTTDKLTEHQQVLHSLITEAGEIAPGTLYDRYCATVENPRTRRTMRNHLAKLEQYNLILATGNTKARSYQPRS
jgi:orc1/cdc6 family replication initiation protein